MAKFLIVEARFYDHLNDMLVAGAKAALKAKGHEVEVITVPGALEIPGTIAMAAEAQMYDGFVAIGVVIRGETYHFEIVAGERRWRAAQIAQLAHDLAAQPNMLTAAWSLQRAEEIGRAHV